MTTARVEEVVGEFVHLKKSGTSYKGLSPWTSEKTPSFFVVPSKGIFKDFSSGKGGNVVKFLMEHEQFSYPEALRYLADKYQIEIPEEDPTDDQLKERDHRESLAVVQKFAMEYFVDQLWKGEEGRAVGLSYFRERGFNDSTIEKFALGFCPSDGSAFTETALDKGYQLEYLKETGLTRERDTRRYDFFRGRVIFPLRNLSGRVLAFGARTLSSDKKVPKYVNSPENALYHKSKVVFGLYESKTAIIREDNCYMVEGYTDVISLHQSGIENVVASSGTALTRDQLRMIHRYTENLTILFDGDEAGQAAAGRGIDLALEEGINIRCLVLPEGEDPDSFAQSHSENELREFLEGKAQDFIAFRADALNKSAKDDPIEKAKAVRKIVESIALVPDHIARSVYVQECSKRMNVPEQALLSELNKIIRQRNRQKDSQAKYAPEPPIEPIPQKKEDNQPDNRQVERELVRILLKYGESMLKVEVQNEDTPEHTEEIEVHVAEYILHEIENDDLRIEDSVCRKVLDKYEEFVENEEIPDSAVLVRDPDPQVSELVADLVSSPYILSDNWDAMHRIAVEDETTDLRRTVDSPLIKLRQRKVMQLMLEIDKQIEEVEDEEELTNLIQEKVRLNEIKTKITSYFGSTII